jgi:nucleotide-binding universal stress UspA family protein
MKKILIPIDGSPLSVKVGENAVQLGKLIDAELIFITVVNMPSEEKYAHFGMTVENQFIANRKEMLVDSVTQKVISAAPCPVIVING